MTPLAFYRSVIKPAFDPKNYVVLTSDPRRRPLELFGSRFAFTVVPKPRCSSSAAKASSRKGPESPEREEPLDQRSSNFFFNLGSVAAVKRAAARALKAGEPLWFSCDVNKFYDRERQMLNARASSVERLTGDAIWTLPKKALYHTSAIENLHAMTLVGHDGAGDRWKVENSWGAAEGLVMSGPWFDRFVLNVVVPVRFLDDSERKGLRTALAARDGGSPMYLVPPWDIYAAPQ
jgi:aminopeptidase C